MMKRSIQILTFFLLTMSYIGAQAADIIAARVWPAKEYTRIALESKTPIQYQLLMLDNPERLVVDMVGMEQNTIVSTLATRVLSSDPYIKDIRVAMFKPEVLRVVIDLKSAVNPNVFTLPPAGQYANRLVIDLYPKKGKKAAKAETKPVAKPDKKVTKTEAKKPIKTKPRKAKKEIVIAVDAGHGGEDPGALGAKGSREKVITLSIAKKLKAKIDKQPNMRAVLTRSGDYFVPLRDRVRKARKHKADLFISIHADAFTRASARGSSVFALSQSGATSEGARYLAKKENQSDLIGGVSLNYQDRDLAKTLLDLSQTATINDGIKLGQNVLSRIGKINTLHSKRVEQAAFAVLKAPDIPSILVETAFISNPEEEKKLLSSRYQNKLCDSILAGIKAYLKSNPSMVSQLQ